MRHRERRSRLILGCLLGALVACGGGESVDDAAGWSGTVSTEGDVTTVANGSGSVWGGEAQLVEEMSIGVDVGEDEYMLGGIGSLYATADRLYVTDGQEPAVRVYDTEGRFIRNIGSGPGQGPGEYELPILVKGAADGTIFVYDARVRRVTGYDAEGTMLDTWTPTRPSCCAWRMAVSPDGTLWMPVEQPMFESPTGEERYGAQAYRLGEGKVGEVRWNPQIDYPRRTFEIHGITMLVPYSPGYSWSLSGDGGLTVGTSDRYRFEVRRIDGSTLIVERDAEPAPVDPAEAEWRRAWTLKNMRTNIEPDFSVELDIPDHKPAFGGFAPGADGGTWVERRGASRHLDGNCVDDPTTTDLATSRDNSCWESDRFFDIFDPQGRYLGWVRAPDGLSPWNAQLNLYPMGEVVYAIIESAEGVPMVKRYRVVPPGVR
ncbi:MAG: 6-bladed beta-propeller [Acidobacteriota bacterium]